MKDQLRVLLTLAGVLLMCAILSAQTIHPVYEGDGTLKSAIEAAADGDILELMDSGRVYATSNTDKIVVDKTITIRAAEGLEQKPIVRNTNLSAGSARLFEIQAGGNLYLQGLDLDCRAEDGGAPHAKNAIRSQDVADTSGAFHFKLKVENCILHYSKESLVKAHRYTIGDTVSFKNSIFDRATNEALLFRESTSNLGPDIRYLEVENCTFTRIGREALYLEFSNPVIRINHCTFDSISVKPGDNKRIVYPRNVDDVEVRNSIFTNQLGTQSEAIELHGNSTISHSDLFNVGTIDLNGSATIGDNILNVDPLYTDPANSDYALAMNSPVLGMADDGNAMGDLRWDPLFYLPKVIQVKAGENTLHEAIDAASEGDTLELVSSGKVYEYNLSDKMIINKTLTIRAREGLAQKPIIRNTRPSTSSARIFEIVAGGNLYLQGLDLDCRAEDGGAPHAKNAIRSQDVADTSGAFHFELKVEDCILHYSTEALVKAHRYTIGDTIIFKNCIFDRATNEALLFRESTSNLGPDIRYLEVENCTFTRIGREALYLEFSNPVIRINHCTFDSISVKPGDNKRIVYPRYVDDVEIRNSIFTNQLGTQSEAVELHGNSTISYSDLFNVGSIDLNGSATTGDGMLNVDPLYADPANGDYRLATSSPVRGMADDGRAMGDLRWEADPGQFYLTIITQGAGIVTKDPEGPFYDPGTSVTLTAVPDAGWEFDSWVGNVFPPTANPVSITLNSDETVTAKFKSLTPQVTLNVSTLGLGSVEIDPETESGTYDLGSSVTLTAVPDENWEFVEWQGDISRVENPTTVQLDSNMNITASFASVFTQFTLNITVVGKGNVIQAPEPILGTYDSSAVVKLTAEPLLGWEFTGWSGDLTSTGNPDSVVMDSDKNVTATFSEISFENRSMEIDTTWDLRDAVEFANNNSNIDSLILITSGGLYTSTNTSDVAVRAPLTIVAAPGLEEKPVITNSDTEGSNLDVFRVFDDFTLKGVVLDGGHEKSHGMKYGIRLRHYDGSDSVKTGLNITVLDCDFKDFYEKKNPLADGHAVRFDKDLVAGTVRIENSTFTNFGYEAIRISETEKYATDRALDSLIVRNSTFTNIDAECVRYYSDISTETPDAPVIIEHITVNNSATRIIYLKNSGGAIVRDIIVANSRLSGHGRDEDIMDAQGAGTVVSHIDTFNVKPVPIKSGKGGFVDEETVWGIDPKFEDAENLNYTLMPASHLYGLAHDGEALGDLNWAINTPNHVYLNVTVIDSGMVVLDPAPIGKTYDPGTVVTLTAIADSGWQFTGWGGDLSGSNNPETITMNDHKNVTATFEVITGLDDLAKIPTEYKMENNYPNPFNPETTIKFQLPQNGKVRLVIYNILGQAVRTLVDTEMEPGYYQAVWDGRSDQGIQMASGVYIYRIQAGKFNQVKKMILLK